MGMYNEVHKACPNCKKGIATAQISQIVLGFGNFDLDNPKQLADKLSVNELNSLVEEVENAWFVCNSCDQSFKL